MQKPKIFIQRIRPRWLVAGVFFALLAAAPLSAIEPGLVFMTTSDLKPTVWKGSLLGGELAPGADPILDFQIVQQGKPFTTAEGSPSLGSADTVIEVEGTSFSTDHVESREIRTRVVAINLVSAEPVTVTYNGTNPELWDARVCVSTTELWQNEPADGRMVLTNDCNTAGSFVSTLLIRPKVVFTRRRDNAQKVFDLHAGMLPVILISHGYWTKRSSTSGEFLTVPAGAVIVQDCDGELRTTLSKPTSDIVLGLERTGCNWLFPEQGYLAIRPIAQSFSNFQIMQPTPSIGRPEFPFPLDNRSATPVCEPVSGRP